MKRRKKKNLEKRFFAAYRRWKERDKGLAQWFYPVQKRAVYLTKAGRRRLSTKKKGAR